MNQKYDREPVSIERFKRLEPYCLDAVGSTETAAEGTETREVCAGDLCQAVVSPVGVVPMVTPQVSPVGELEIITLSEHGGRQESAFRNSYEALISTFNINEVYTREQVLSGLRNLGLAGEGLFGSIKGLYNLHCVHGADGDRALFMTDGLEWVYFRSVGDRKFKFQIGYETM